MLACCKSVIVPTVHRAGGRSISTRLRRRRPLQPIHSALWRRRISGMIPRWFPRWLLSAIAVILQILATVMLITHGLIVQCAGTTLSGALIGWHCRPAARRSDVPAITLILAVWSVQLLIHGRDPTTSHLLDQAFVATLVTLLWPKDPQDRIRKQLQAVLRRARRWSTGVPLAPSP